jgi:hypothetical protein
MDVTTSPGMIWKARKAATETRNNVIMRVTIFFIKYFTGCTSFLS